MINHFRAEMPRPIIGIGHSIGPAQLFASPPIPIPLNEKKAAKLKPPDLFTQDLPLHNPPTPLLDPDPHRTRHRQQTPTRTQYRRTLHLPTRPLAQPPRRGALLPNPPVLLNLAPTRALQLPSLRSPSASHTPLPFLPSRSRSRNTHNDKTPIRMDDPAL